MIVAFAGRRAQSMDGDLDAVATRVRRLLTALAPTAVVGALSDGGDLLVAEAALGIASGPTVHVILPTPEDVFRSESVREDWRDRFDRVLEQVRRDGTVRSLDLEDGSEAYRRANAAYLEMAAELAEQTGERVMTLLIAGEGEGVIVEDLVARGELRNAPSVRIDPDVIVTHRPRVLVVMPYGRKHDPERRIDVDCELVYSKILVPALENAQLFYRRADEEIDSGVVLQPMIEWLAESELVIGDLGTANFNVGWELGLRHLLRSRQTLLIGPAGTKPPFDLNLVRHVRYHHDAGGVSDDAAVEAWAALAPYLRAVGAGSGSDSPVAAVMDVTQWGAVKPRSAPDARWEKLREQLALARETADGDLMLEVLDGATGMDEGAVMPLRAEAGVGLVRLGRYRDARRLLLDVTRDDPEVLRPEAHVYYAQALYRPSDADIDAYDAAEKVLKRVLVKSPAQPEVHAMLGAIAKRRVRLRGNAAGREPDLRLAIESYRRDYEGNLNAYYQGINVVALAVALHLGYADDRAGRLAREFLPSVRLAAAIALRSQPHDYWATATLAECALHESLLGIGNPNVAEAYRAAGALRPRRGDLDSTVSQLDLLHRLGLPVSALAGAREGLSAGSGVLLPR